MMQRKWFRIGQMVLGLLLVFSFTEAAAGGEWVSFDGGSPDERVEVDVVESDASRVIVDIKIPGMQVSEARRALDAMDAYQIVNIPGAGHISEIGKPQIPMVSRFIAIPLGATVNIEVVDAAHEDVAGYYIYPAQPPLLDVANAQTPPFSLQEDIYQQNGFYPSEIVDAEGPIVIRGCSSFILRVFPVQFNPAARTLRIYSAIRVKVSFDQGETNFIEERWRSPSFDSTFERLFLNNPVEWSAGGDQAAYDTGDALLIITHPNFRVAADKLQLWKVQKGISTYVRTTAQTGRTASAIQDYIKDAYNNWDPPPTYVLLIGDAEFIPCHYRTIHPAIEYGQGKVATDLYYATVDGNDYFPDISIGRLAVDTGAEAIRRVNDIIGYEKNPVALHAYYSTAAICTYFQHESEGYAARRFAQTSEDLAIYLSDPGYLGAYMVDRIYYTPPSVTPTNWGTADWNFGGGPAGDPGAAIPSYLLRSNGFNWEGDSSDITTAVNSGTFLLTHRDHGATWGWGQPQYTTRDVQALTNGNKLPVVWSVNCQTGWFDNETDDSSCGTPSETICFSEAWERNSNGGAVGVIAATRISYSGPNDRLVWGWTDAIWPGFVSSYSASGTPFSNPAYEMGQVLNYGKYYCSTVLPDDIYRKTTFEMFHWFGDPTQQIWTSVPQSLSVSHPFTLSDWAKSMVVNVDQAGASICVSRRSTILARMVSVSGDNTISWSTHLRRGDKVYVTVTKHDHRPYQGSATVIGGPPNLRGGR